MLVCDREVAENDRAAGAEERLPISRRRSASTERAPMEILFFRVGRRRGSKRRRELHDTRLSIYIVPPIPSLATQHIRQVVKASFKTFIFQRAAILTSFWPREP